MASSRAWPAAAIGVALALTVVSGRQIPSRDRAPAESWGRASISGIVVLDDGSNQPLRQVTIALLAPNSSIQRVTTTDDSGRFAFAGLPAESYGGLRATKPAYVPAAYGQKRVGGIGTPISLAPDQQLAVAIRMTRGAVITGTVLDEAGRPAAHLFVRAALIRTVNGERLPSPARGTAATNENGVYRIYGLMPGDYLVGATPRLAATGEIRAVTPQEVAWGQDRLRPSDPRPIPPPRPGQAVSYAPVYYPGTPVPARAALVPVVAGQEQSGIDFGTELVPTAYLEGEILTPDGQPAQDAQVLLVPKIAGAADLPFGSSTLLESMASMRPAVVRGRFSVAGVLPGEYTISARAPMTAGEGTPPQRGQSARGAPSGGRSLWAAADVAVSGADLTNLVLQLAPGLTLSGRARFEAVTAQSLDGAGLRLVAAPDPTGFAIAVNIPTTTVAADGSFRFDGIAPGKYLLSASEPGGTRMGPWTLETALIDNVDMADVPVELGSGRNHSEVVVTFGNSAAEVSGTVSDASGRPTSDFAVILFSTNRIFWSPQSRRVKSPVRTNAGGAFRFTSVVFGEYYLAVLTDFEPSDVNDPAFLEQVVPSALKITVAGGEKKVQDLKLASGG